MKSIKKKTVFILMYLICCIFCLFADVDPFYTKVFKEGKDYFAAGNFQEAVVNFKIAEFGLFDEQEVLKEIYLYYSLAQFQLGRMDETREIVKKFADELNIKNLETITIPQAIRNPIKAMLAALAMPRKTGEISYWRKIYNFELLFLETMQNLEAQKLDMVGDGLRKLENINKKESRLYYIRGILKFKQKDYKACVKALKTFDKVKPLSFGPSLLDSLYYYLGLSYHYLKNTKQTAVYYNKVKDISIKSELYQEIKKDKEEMKDKIKKQKKK